MDEVKDKFIILKKTKYSEADLIIQALSVDGSKKSFIARGALKSKKRFGGGLLEPTHYLFLTYKPGRSEDQLNVIQDAVLIEDFKALRTDYDKLEFALQICNCAYHVSQEGDVDSHFLFNLVGHGLKNLAETKNLDRYKLHFYLKFLFQQGVISFEDWMNDFLKYNLSESESLDENEKVIQAALDKLFLIEDQVQHYIKNATL